MCPPQVTIKVLNSDFHEDDAYSRDCTAFKVSWQDSCRGVSMGLDTFIIYYKLY